MSSLAPCRICRRTGLQSVICLGRMPLVNEFRPAAAGHPARRYPLHLLNCVDCALPQLAGGVSPAEMFPDYAYFSSASEPVVQHAAGLYDFVTRLGRLAPHGFVLEVGSNDGYLLDFYRKQGYRVLGVDPARNVAAQASRMGVPTVADFFSAELAADLRSQYGRASVVHASNVLAHVPAIPDVLTGVRLLLDDDGLFVLETPSIVELIRRGLYDTVYHEHAYCYSFTALHRLLMAAGMPPVSVETVAAHGGTLRVVASSNGIPDESIERYLGWESRLGVTDGSLYVGYSDRVDRFLQMLEDELGQLSRAGRLAGLGAAAKTGIVLNSIQADLSYVCDSTLYKQGTFVPGTEVPVVPPERLRDDPPDYCVLFPWNHAEAMIHANADYLRAGGVFVTAVDFRITEISADADGKIQERIRAELPE